MNLNYRIGNPPTGEIFQSIIQVHRHYRGIICDTIHFRASRAAGSPWTRPSFSIAASSTLVCQSHTSWREDTLVFRNLSHPFDQTLHADCICRRPNCNFWRIIHWLDGTSKANLHQSLRQGYRIIGHILRHPFSFVSLLGTLSLPTFSMRSHG